MTRTQRTDFIKATVFVLCVVAIGLAVYFLFPKPPVSYKATLYSGAVGGAELTVTKTEGSDSAGKLNAPETQKRFSGNLNVSFAVTEELSRYAEEDIALCFLTTKQYQAYKAEEDAAAVLSADGVYKPSFSLEEGRLTASAEIKGGELYHYIFLLGRESGEWEKLALVHVTNYNFASDEIV